MVDLNSNRFMKDVGPVGVTAKDHEVKPGIQEAMAKGRAPGVNSSFQLDGAQEVTVGADGKGVVTATVVAQKPEADKPAPAKGAKPGVAEASGAINNRAPAVGVAAPTAAPAIGAPQSPAARLGRQPGRGLATRPVGTPAVSTRPNANLTTPNPAQQGALAVKAKKEDGPKGKDPAKDAKAAPKPAGGELKVERVAVTVDLKETRREKILSMFGGAPEGPEKNALAGRRHDYSGAKPKMGGAESATVNALADKGPQIEVPKVEGDKPAAKPAAAKVVPKTATMAQLPPTAPRAPGSAS